MTFSNTDIIPENLPILEHIETQALSEKYRPVHIATGLVFYVIVALLSSITRFQPFVALPDNLVNAYPYVITITLLLAIITCTYRFFADPIKRYSIREQDISFTSGLFFRKTLCQPILRIQHIEIKRGPVERAAGIASLQVFSAGGAAHTFEIPGLDLTIAQKMRQFILDHKDVNQHG